LLSRGNQRDKKKVAKRGGTNLEEKELGKLLRVDIFGPGGDKVTWFR